MENLCFKELLAYNRGELTEKRKSEIKKFFKKNPDYEDLLKGIKKLEEELNDDETIENYLKSKKNELLKKIIPGFNNFFNFSAIDFLFF